MNRHKRTTLVLAACGSLLAGTGCSRTSDGSVVMNTPSMPRLFASNPEPLAATPDLSATPDQVEMVAELPPPPPPAQAPRRGRSHAKAMPGSGWKMQTVKAPFERSNPEEPLDCRNETSPQGRVKVVCE